MKYIAVFIFLSTIFLPFIAGRTLPVSHYVEPTPTPFATPTARPCCD